ncbi:MAG TPA: hypothetical protein VL171_07300 [Verrucomicrobiae bacterium]|nr:hypothetical protein [Verrucomicrobiae bacterium]
MNTGPAFLLATGGLAIVAVFIVLPAFAKRSASKRFTKAPDRRVIEAKIGTTHACRALMAAEVLVLLAFGFFVAVGVDTNFVTALFAFAFVAILAGRVVTRQTRNAAEAELEYRRLHGEKV